MRLDRLFHVLVVMSGAPAVAACGSEDDRDERREGPDDPGADGGVSTIDGSTSTGDGGELAPCFCNTQTCCDRSSESAHVLPGFECCWSTTCP